MYSEELIVNYLIDIWYTSDYLITVTLITASLYLSPIYLSVVLPRCLSFTSASVKRLAVPGEGVAGGYKRAAILGISSLC